jgi:hypothetical protein
MKPVDLRAPYINDSHVAHRWLDVLVDQGCVAVERPGLSFLGDMLVEKTIGYFSKCRDPSIRAALGGHIDPLLYAAEQLSRFDSRFVRRHAPMGA